MAVKLYQREDFDHFETVQTRWKDMDALRHINRVGNTRTYRKFMRNQQCFNSRTMTNCPAYLPEFTINKESLTIPCHIDKG